jgi:hypothetical protein
MKKKYRRSSLDYLNILTPEAKDYERVSSFLKITEPIGFMTSLPFKYIHNWIKILSVIFFIFCSFVVLDAYVISPHAPIVTSLLLKLFTFASEYFPSIDGFPIHPIHTFLDHLLYRLLIAIIFSVILFGVGFFATLIIRFVFWPLILLLSRIFLDEGLRQCGALVDRRVVRRLQKRFMKDFRTAESHELDIFLKSEKYLECPANSLTMDEIRAALNHDTHSLSDEFSNLLRTHKNVSRRFKLINLLWENS